MWLGRFKSDAARWAVLGLCVGATCHFAVSCLIWGRVLVSCLGDPSPPWRRFLLDGGPAAVFLLWFTTAGVLAWRRLRASVAPLLLGIVLASALFVHDAVTRNWQMHAHYLRPSAGKTFFYFTWWWYDQRWLEQGMRWLSATAPH